MASSGSTGAKAGGEGVPLPHDGSYMSLAMSLLRGGGPAPHGVTGREVGSLTRLRRAVVFTDVVGAMELKQSQGDERAWFLMERHHELLRGVLKTFPDGLEIETAGDSFLLSFGRPGDAVRFALELQSRLRQWASGDPPLRDRVGIHVGEVFVFDEEALGRGPMLFGLPVDTCWRVMSLAVGDQILLTRGAYDLARSELDGGKLAGLGGIEWTSHGWYRVRGIAEPMELLEVGERGRAAFVAPEEVEESVRPPAGVVVPWRVPSAQQLTQNPS